MAFRTSRDRSVRSALLISSSALAAAGLAATASAQEATETVVVTGSRIPQTGLYSSSPVTAVGQQEMKLTGSTSIEQTLRMLPSAVADVDNQFTNNASAGENNVDLRGLGTTRTLVLVDGKRLVAADQLGEVDLSIIPPGLVDHIEVYTGGASAIYGSDAIAGVVNVILKKDFQGLQFDSSYKQTDSNDGQTFDVNGIMGFDSSDGKGNVTIYADYQNRRSIFQGNRVYSAHALNSPSFTGCGTPATHFGGFCFGGSSSSAEGQFSFGGQTYFPSADGPGNSDFVACGHTGQPPCFVYNFNPVNYYQTPNVRYAFGGEGHYEVSKFFDFYTRLTFSDNQVLTQLAPTPIISTFAVNYANPFLSAQQRGLLFAGCIPGCGPNDTSSFGFRRRLVENGNRDTSFDRTAYQIVVGARGELGGGWTYDFSAQYGHTGTTQRFTGDAKFNNFGQGLLVDASGTCLDSTGGCVPIDIFSQHGISGAAAKFFTLSMDALTTVEQWDVQGATVGDLHDWGLQSPWAKNAVAVSFGGEYRQEAAKFEPDDNLATSNDLGFGGSPPVHGSYNVTEGFGEVRVPVIEGMPFAELLQFEGAYRYSSYSRAGAVSTYKYSGEWSPTDDFRLRGSFERAVRAPNVNELFSTSTVSANAGKDPCSDLNGSAVGFTTTAALCLATGVPAGQLFSNGLECPAGQCTAFVGGNPNLKPETADTRSAGIVFTPTFFEGFSATVDYYNIKVDGFITGLPLQLVLNNCYDPAKNPSQDPNNPFCQLVHRNGNGEIFGEPVPPGGEVTTLSANIGKYQVKGWDIESSYQANFGDWGMDQSWGGFALDFIGTYQPTSKFQANGAVTPTACAGKFGSICIDGAPTPKWKHNFRVSWLSPDNDVTISMLWRHISSEDHDIMRFSGKNSATPCGFNACDAAGDDNHIPAFDWFDLSGTWDMGNGIQFRGGVTNIFDKRPPLIDINLSFSSVDSGNTFPGTYDAVGRFLFAGVTIKM